MPTRLEELMHGTCVLLYMYGLLIQFTHMALVRTCYRYAGQADRRHGDMTTEKDDIVD